MNFNQHHIIACLRDTMSKHAINLTAIEKAQYAATIVGAAVGASVYMPSAPVDIPRNFFLTNHTERATRILATINEDYPINIDLALSIASNTFLARYRLVFEPAFTVHMLGHLAGCSDDVVPTTIRDILLKVNEANDSMALLNVSKAITIAIGSGE